jgi:hypothetical protein
MATGFDNTVLDQVILNELISPLLKIDQKGEK